MIQRGIEKLDRRIAFVASQVRFRHVVQRNGHPHAVLHPTCVNGNSPRAHVALDVLQGAVNQLVGGRQQFRGKQGIQRAPAAARRLGRDSGNPPRPIAFGDRATVQ